MLKRLLLCFCLIVLTIASATIIEFELADRPANGFDGIEGAVLDGLPTGSVTAGVR